MTHQAAASHGLVSVVIPTYNHQHFLRAAVSSVLEQSYRDIEIIVQDDASDGGIEQAMAGLDNDDRVRCYVNPQRLGIAGNWIAALAKVRGDYVAVLCDDDVWHADFLETLLPPLAADARLALAFCDLNEMDEAGRIDPELTRIYGERYGRAGLEEGVYSPFHREVLVDQAACISASVFRRDALDWHQIPRESGNVIDLYLYYLAARSGGGAWYATKRLVDHRIHAAQATHATLSSADQQALLRRVDTRIFVWDRLAEDPALADSRSHFDRKRGHAIMERSWRLARLGRIGEALSGLRAAYACGVLDPGMVASALLRRLRVERSLARDRRTFAGSRTSGTKP